MLQPADSWCATTDRLGLGLGLRLAYDPSTSRSRFLIRSQYVSVSFLHTIPVRLGLEKYICPIERLDLVLLSLHRGLGLVYVPSKAFLSCKLPVMRLRLGFVFVLCILVGFGFVYVHSKTNVASKEPIRKG